MAKAIEITEFSYKYPDGTIALSGINLSVEHGEKLALIGPNGAGKSTLLLVMAGFARGTGRVTIDGFEVGHGNLRKIRACLGACLENPEDQLFMPTLFDDIAFGPLNMGLSSEEIEMRVADALATVGLTGMGEKAPHHLSAGQKRAAAIATIISMNPKIITLDEPDGSLDPRNRGNLVRLLKKLSQTLIIATCNMNFAAALAERVVLVDKGRVIADGPAAEVMRDAQLMTKHGLEVPGNVR